MANYCNALLVNLASRFGIRSKDLLEALRGRGGVAIHLPDLDEDISTP
jgi:hypothetical protein